MKGDLAELTPQGQRLQFRVPQLRGELVFTCLQPRATLPTPWMGGESSDLLCQHRVHGREPCAWEEVCRAGTQCAVFYHLATPTMCPAGGRGCLPMSGKQRPEPTAGMRSYRVEDTPLLCKQLVSGEYSCRKTYLFILVTKIY